MLMTILLRSRDSVAVGVQPAHRWGIDPPAARRGAGGRRVEPAGRTTTGVKRARSASERKPSMDPQTVAADEARRIAQHELVKSKLEEDVHARIARESAASSPAEQDEVKSVAAGLKHKATREVAETEGELQRARLVTRVSQVGDYVFYLVYGLIGLEIVLQLFGARQASGFKRLLDVGHAAGAGPVPRAHAGSRRRLHAVDAVLCRRPGRLRPPAPGLQWAPATLRATEVEHLEAAIHESPDGPGGEMIVNGRTNHAPWGLLSKVRALRIASGAGTLFAFFLIFSGLFSLLRGDSVAGVWSILLGWLIKNGSSAGYRAGAPRRDPPLASPCATAMVEGVATIPGSGSVAEAAQRSPHAGGAPKLPGHAGRRRRRPPLPQGRVAAFGRGEGVDVRSRRHAPADGRDGHRSGGPAPGGDRQDGPGGTRQLLVVEGDRLLGLLTINGVIRRLQAGAANREGNGDSMKAIEGVLEKDVLLARARGPAPRPRRWRPSSITGPGSEPGRSGRAPRSRTPPTRSCGSRRRPSAAPTSTS